MALILAHLVLAPGRFLRVIAEVDDEAAVRRQVEQVGGHVDVHEERGLSPLGRVLASKQGCFSPTKCDIFS